VSVPTGLVLNENESFMKVLVLYNDMQRVPHSIPVISKSHSFYEPATHVGNCKLLKTKTDKSR